MVPIITNKSPELLFTVRSRKLSSYQGQVAFPGGYVETQDASLCATALRETQEEIQMLTRQIEIVGQLTPRQSLTGVWVFPHVGLVDHQSSWAPNPQEVEHIFTVPLSHFEKNAQTSSHVMMRAGIRTTMPVFQIGEHCIWGLTAIFVAELSYRLFQVNYDHLHDNQTHKHSTP